MNRRQAFRALEALAAKYHLEFDGVTAKSHYRWRHTVTGRLVITISTLGSWRSLRNAERDFRSIEDPHGQHHHTN